MRILHIAQEVAPYHKTGEAAEIAGALPRAMAALGEEVALVAPRNDALPIDFGLARRLRTVTVSLSRQVFELTIFEGRLAGGRSDVRVWLIDHPVFERALAGPDTPLRDVAVAAALLARAAEEVARSFGFAAEVVHAHGWAAALALMHVRRTPETRNLKTVLTLHDPRQAGRFPRSFLDTLGIDPSLDHVDGVEFFGDVSLLKAGILAADRIVALSPRHAEEMQQPEQGAGFAGLLRARSEQLTGVLGGIDTNVWNPKRDPALAERFDADDPSSGKRQCKVALQLLLGLPERPRTPLAAAVLPLTAESGMDALVGVLEGLVGQRDHQVVVLGSGDAALEERLVQLSRSFPTKLVVRRSFDDTLVRRLYAAADLCIIPARSDPSGRSAMYALRYGAVPVVRNIGGLRDVVVDYDPHSKTGTGFVFSGDSAEALDAAWRRALNACTTDEGWGHLVRRGMNRDCSWAASARSCLALYRGIQR